MTFATGKEAVRRRKAKVIARAARAANNRVPKRLGVSQDPKGPVYCEKHLALVRAQQCLITQSHGCVAHHPRELFPRSGGKRITDFLAVPLRPDQHDGYDWSLHKSGKASWWNRTGLHDRGVFSWLKGFLRRHYPSGHPGVTQALEMIAAEEAKRKDPA